jgi:hypothetical protein
MGNRICLIKDDDQVLCTVHPGLARRLLTPFPPCFSKIADPDSDNSDAGEEQACLDEWAELFYDFNLADDDGILQIHSTRSALVRHIFMKLFRKVYMISITRRKSLQVCDLRT